MMCRSNITFGLKMAACHHKPFLQSEHIGKTGMTRLALGSKSEPPLPPPMGSVVSEFLKICSNPRNLTIDSVTVGVEAEPACKQKMVLLRANRQQEISVLLEKRL